jgi:hypothetical protein
MKLNKYHKTAFVRAVMADVPTINYEEIMVQELQDHAITLFPKEVLATYKNEATRPYLRHEGIYLNDFGYVRGFYPPEFKPNETFGERIEELRSLKKVQDEHVYSLRNKLTASIEACTTREKAVKVMPELEKYLPKSDYVPLADAPAIVDLVKDLTALGWPKDSEKAAA